MNPLLLKYLNSARVFETPNDQGKEPKKPVIKVESVDNRKDKDANPDLVDNRNDKDEEGDDEEDNEDDEESDNNEKEETDEEKTARLAKQAEEKEERRQVRVQKRIDKLTAEKNGALNEIAELKKQLAEKPVEGLTEEEVERRAAKKAEELAAAKEADRLQKEFEKTADTLIKAASKVDKDFEKKINEVAADTGVLMPKYMVEILAELDYKNGHEILAQLANDDDLYEEICVMSERRMTKRLEKMSEELKTRVKVKPNKERERLPEPIEPVDGDRNRGNNIPNKPTQNMDEYVRIRNEQTAALRKQGKNVW